MIHGGGLYWCVNDALTMPPSGSGNESVRITRAMQDTVGAFFNVPAVALAVETAPVLSIVRLNETVPFNAGSDLRAKS